MSSCSNPHVTYPHWPQMTTCPPLDWSLLPEEPLLHSVEYGIQILVHWKWNPFQQKLYDFEGDAGPWGTSSEALRKEEWTSHECHMSISTTCLPNTHSTPFTHIWFSLSFPWFGWGMCVNIFLGHIFSELFCRMLQSFINFIYFYF